MKTLEAAEEICEFPRIFQPIVLEWAQAADPGEERGSFKVAMQLETALKSGVVPGVSWAEQSL